MPLIHIKLNDNDYQALKAYSGQHGLKLTETVRSFIKASLSFAQNPNQQSKHGKSEISYFDKKIGEYILESLVLTRKIVELSLDNDEKQAKSTISDAAKRAQSHLKKILDDSSNLI